MSYKKFKKKDLIYLIQLLKTPHQTIRRNDYPGHWVISNTWNGNSDPLGNSLSEIMDYIEPMPEEKQKQIDEFREQQERKRR